MADEQESPAPEQKLPLVKVMMPDPHAGHRAELSESDGVHKSWQKDARAIRTVEDFLAFHDHLIHDYKHDYGTVVHAISAVSVAAACLCLGDPANGGISGAQASGVMWEWLAGWGTGPANAGRMLDYEDMLWPNYERKFNQLSHGTWTFLQQRAAEELAADDLVVEGPEMGKDGARIKASPRVRAHWQSIVDGVVPFGYKLEPANEVPAPTPN